MNPVPGPRRHHDDQDEQDERVAALLRATLTREADMVEPGDGYDALREQVADEERPHGRRGGLVWLAAAAAVVVVGGVVGVLALGGDDNPPPAAGTTTATADPTPTPSATMSAPPSTTTPPPPAPELTGVPMYWLGDSTANVWLYREFRTLPDEGGTVRTAVLAAMSERPLDPDHRTPWSAPSRLDVSTDENILIDVSADAFAGGGLGSREAELAIQQVVWTATAAAQSDAPVTILVDGAPYDAWGAVALGGAMTRAPQPDVQAPVWIESPTEGQQVAPGVVTVTGVSSSFEATLSWELTTDDAEVVATGFTKGGSIEHAPYELATPALAPGTYTIAVWAPDESGGESPEGPRMFEQTRTFTVG